jgi:DNA replication protein DnaC
MSAERALPESLGHSLRKLLGHAEYQRLIDLGRDVQPEVELVCPRCNGAGWLRLDVQPGHQDFGRLIECRCGLVAARRANIYQAASRIPEQYANLDLATFPDQRISDVMRAWWTDLPSPWLVLSGDLGTGKTGLTIGLVKRALSEGRSALFRPFVELLSDIKATFRTRDASGPDEADMMRALKTVEVLALDDLGAERATGWAQERLFEVLNHRYNERRRTILTTNLGPVEMADHLGDRIVSRIDGMGWIYAIEGPNLRAAR